MNPYAPPTAEISEVAVTSAAPADALAIRQAHVSHESSIRSVGILLLVGGVLGVMMALVTVLAGVAIVFGGELSAGLIAIMLGMGLVYGLLGAAQLWVGRGLRRLDGRARIPAIVLSALAMLSVPIGTILGGYMLYLLASERGREVFSPEYQAVIAATPGVRARTSPATWAVFGLVVIGGVALLALVLA